MHFTIQWRSLGVRDGQRVMFTPPPLHLQRKGMKYFFFFSVHVFLLSKGNFYPPLATTVVAFRAPSVQAGDFLKQQNSGHKLYSSLAVAFVGWVSWFWCAQVPVMTSVNRRPDDDPHVYISIQFCSGGQRRSLKKKKTNKGRKESWLEAKLTPPPAPPPSSPTPIARLPTWAISQKAGPGAAGWFGDRHRVMWLFLSLLCIVWRDQGMMHDPSMIEAQMDQRYCISNSAMFKPPHQPWG